MINIFSTKEEIEEELRTLTLQKMKIERFFSEFLDTNELDIQGTNTPEWFTYKEMFTEFERIKKDITIANYYMERVKHEIQNGKRILNGNRNLSTTKENQSRGSCVGVLQREYA